MTRINDPGPASHPNGPAGLAGETVSCHELATLRESAQRVLWLSAAIVDAANRGRPNTTGIKVGGHQAPSASMADIMVALWFHELTSHGTVDPSLPPRTTRPNLDPQPCTPAARPERVRTPPQRTPPTSRHRELPASASAARPDHRTRHADTSHHPPTRPTRRAPPRTPESRLTSADGVFGTRRVKAHWSRREICVPLTLPLAILGTARALIARSIWPSLIGCNVRGRLQTD